MSLLEVSGLDIRYGAAEVVYNDECYMRVYSGSDGTVLAQVPQNSHTLIEYPLIVDAEDHLVFGYSDDSSTNGSAGVTYAYGVDINLDCVIEETV